MAKSIKNRVFGSTVPDWLKQKIQLRQAFSKTSNMEDAFNSVNVDAGKVDFNREFNFFDYENVHADLSSRTPFARMWTGLSIFEDVKIDVPSFNTDKDVEGWWANRAKGLDGKDKETWENKYLKDTGGGTFEEYEWKKISANFQRIYVLGNHILNSEEAGANTERTNKEGVGGISAATMKAILPFEQETDANQFLKPPAGITSITSETEGPLGSLKKTTVSFVVHNFYDFEKIYLKYFMKPGAQVFIDFGWDTAGLYAPEELLTKDDIEDYLYGETGVVPR